MNKDISTQLREIKSHFGWSELRIGEAIGASQPTVNRILNGQDDCRGSTLMAIQNLHKKIRFKNNP